MEKKFEAKKLSRDQMKSVLGGLGKVCQTDVECAANESCIWGDNRKTCQKNEVQDS